jgi:uncharacterized protein YbaR (Trm112 family)
MIDDQLLEILCCPETKQPVALAPSDMIDRINAKITAGELLNRGGQKVQEKIDGGLVREDRKFLYPIRDEIPIMLEDEAISLEGLQTKA